MNEFFSSPKNNDSAVVEGEQKVCTCELGDALDADFEHLRYTFLTFFQKSIFLEACQRKRQKKTRHRSMQIHRRRPKFMKKLPRRPKLPQMWLSKPKKSIRRSKPMFNPSNLFWNRFPASSKTFLHLLKFQKIFWLFSPQNILTFHQFLKSVVYPEPFNREKYRLYGMNRFFFHFLLKKYKF